ncbi:RNA helicase required for poly(A+) mRNA export [Tritrichomonas musculus]|uniref:RNA helicase n=1 Tax=Tritrichomonas musculus TaxID=1915356 RepID=A0ABR2KSL7_9EUKA
MTFFFFEITSKKIILIIFIIKFNHTPLNLAYERGNKEIINILISNGGIDHSSKYLTTILYADAKTLINDLQIENEDDYIEKMQIEHKWLFCSPNNFDELIEGQKSGQLLQAIDDLGFYQPSSIQSKVIPIFNKENILIKSAHGTGKTVAFLVPTLIHIKDEIHFPQVIYLCPTRELALQTYDFFEKLNEYCSYKGEICCTNDIEPSKDAQLLFGTPDAINTHIEEGNIDISHVTLLVIDECNLIFDENNVYYGSTMKIMKMFSQEVKYALISSEITNHILNLYHYSFQIYFFQSIYDSNEKDIHTIQHWYTNATKQEDAMCCMQKLVTILKNGQVIIFSHSKDDIILFCEYLSSNNITCVPYYPDLTLEEKDSNLNSFRNGEYKVLVGTYDISIGIDFPNVNLVINYHISLELGINNNVYDIYGYCASRTGRFGRNGVCFTIVSDSREEYFMKNTSYTEQLKFIQFDQLKSLMI